MSTLHCLLSAVLDATIFIAILFSNILEMFGPPFKKGEQNGKVTWTYQHNQYSAFNDGWYEDLVILFNKNGVVESYRHTASAPSHWEH